MKIEQDAKPVRLWFVGTEVTIRVSETESGDRISVLDYLAPFGNSPPLHRHIDEDEIFHIISGTLRFVVGEKELTASAGDTLLGPRVSLIHIRSVAEKVPAFCRSRRSNNLNAMFVLLVVHRRAKAFPHLLLVRLHRSRPRLVLPRDANMGLKC